MHEKCPVCLSDEYYEAGNCQCGYNFDKQEIVDLKFSPDKNLQKIRAYRSKANLTHWSEEVILKKNITEVQQKKYGIPRWGMPAGNRWTIELTAKLIGEKKNTTSIDIKLANALLKFPQLKECKNKNKARDLQKKLETDIPIKFLENTFDSEKDLQNYLTKNWEKTELYQDWLFRECEYNAGGAGQIDILAYHRKGSKWLIIELKKDNTSDKTVGQILRYMGWVDQVLAREGDKVYGLILTGYQSDPGVYYALKYTKNIDYNFYYLENDKLVFFDAYIIFDLIYN